MSNERKSGANAARAMSSNSASATQVAAMLQHGSAQAVFVKGEGATAGSAKARELARFISLWPSASARNA
jgi:hypothetical protein